MVACDDLVGRETVEYPLMFGIVGCPRPTARAVSSSRPWVYRQLNFVGRAIATHHAKPAVTGSSLRVPARQTEPGRGQT